MIHLYRVSGLSLVCLAVASLIACAPAAKPQQNLHILSYNTQNLFDDHRDGGEYPEFIPGGSSGWNRRTYRQRLERLGMVIRDLAKLPDIVILEEIESIKVLEDLCADFLPANAYPIRSIQADPGSIHIGLLSRVPLQASHSHRVWQDGETARSIWEIWFRLKATSAKAGSKEAEIPSGSLVVFANHWKSKSGGEAESEDLRRLAARTLRDRAAELRTNWPSLDMLACGDLNEAIHTADDVVPAARKSRRGNIRQTVGVSLSQHGQSGTHWALGQRTTKETEPAKLGFAELVVAALDGQSESIATWYSPWLNRAQTGSEPIGSYCYRGKWEAIDHFLIGSALRDDQNWSYTGFQLISDTQLLNDQGVPHRWDSRTKQGYSDHLPILLALKYQEP